MTTIPSEEKIKAIDVQTLGVWKTQSRKSNIGEADEIYKTLGKLQLTSGENNKIAEKILVKQHQIARLTPTIINSLKALNIKQDPDGLFRCYGRLGNSELEDNTKNPLIVLQKSWLADKIIRDCHNKGHPGIGHTMSLVREKYWIPQLRSQIMQILRRCIQCQRFNNLPYKYPEQSDLPQTRVSRSRPFEHVGLDYFGPLLITQQDKTEDKCYGCIITCTVTRLIHLDVVSDLSTVAFLMMLRRFFSRRGVPKSITSDNAPTFRLGESMLNDCIQNIQNDDTVKRLVKQHQIARLTPTIIHSLKALNIKQDPDDLFTCYGRLRNSGLEENAKNLLIVLQKSWLADNIIRECHNKGHLGIAHTMSLVQGKYWIPQLRSQIT
ncbi:hypothetical protein DICVIV_01847 [Dictyocaulus viviparus]|uniref:Integrase catalytic domain-containing protein n=1 Tax=Dictyocaulus viviparus TaxID=29172 RepID=A0A0D8YBL9_DICVI|nr:hypothetical protein DICVIV_01847 [Dictyocaulus viviparus]